MNTQHLKISNNALQIILVLKQNTFIFSVTVHFHWIHIHGFFFPFLRSLTGPGRLYLLFSQVWSASPQAKDRALSSDMMQMTSATNKIMCDCWDAGWIVSTYARFMVSWRTWKNNVCPSPYSLVLWQLKFLAGMWTIPSPPQTDGRVRGWGKERNKKSRTSMIQ